MTEKSLLEEIDIIFDKAYDDAPLYSDIVNAITQKIKELKEELCTHLSVDYCSCDKCFHCKHITKILGKVEG